ncbi:elongation factor G [Candidatus Fermentibacteria bacterium]|nr:elongation factor G [Candidatus Fermentibacteria bacterium]
MSRRIGMIRNIGIIAHIDAGKTTTSEHFLYYSGTTHRIGKIDDGNTVLDYLEQERDRGITITSAAATLMWNNHTINLVDTPGHVDFTVEVERSLMAIDGAVTVLCGVGGVEPQTENVWRRAMRYHLPSIVFVNKMDRIGADFDRAVRMVRERLGLACIVTQLPVGSGNSFAGIIDLVPMEMLVWDQENQGATFSRLPVAEAEADRAAEARVAMLEAIADRDDHFFTLMVEQGNPPRDEILAALRRVTCRCAAVPVVCGAALRNVGIQPLLDAVVAFLPSPQDREPVVARAVDTGEAIALVPDEKEAFCALAFKVMYQESQSRLTYVRVYSGTLEPGHDVYNPTKDVVERPKRFFRMYADKRLKLDRLTAGDVVAVAGFGEAATGDTLCTPARPVVLSQSMDFPIPVVSAAIEPRTRKDEERLARALEKLLVEDPTFSVREDRDTGQTVISAMGELHLEVIVQRLADNFQVDARTGTPQVAYKETVKSLAQAAAHYEKQLAGRVHAATVVVEVSRGAQGSGVLIDFSQAAATLPDDLRNVAEGTIRSSVTSGVLLGYPMTDLLVRLHRIEYAEDAVSTIAVAGAAAKAFQDACAQATPVLLEPHVWVEIALPPEALGAVVESLNARGGKVSEIGSNPAGHTVRSTAPMSKMFGYATQLRSLSQGRASLFMKFSHYAECDRD